VQLNPWTQAFSVTLRVLFVTMRTEAWLITAAVKTTGKTLCDVSSSQKI